MITKAEIASILGLQESDIDDKIYQWAINRFFQLTQFKQNDTQVTYTEIVGSDKYIFELTPPIKSIDSIKINNVTKNWTEYSHYFVDKQRGILKIKNGVSAGSIIEITYTIAGYTHTDLCDYLITLLVYKALGLFTPDKVSFVDSVRIGSYAKRYGAIGDLKENLDQEIVRVVEEIRGERRDIGFGGAV